MSKNVVDKKNYNLHKVSENKKLKLSEKLKINFLNSFLKLLCKNNLKKIVGSSIVNHKK